MGFLNQFIFQPGTQSEVVAKQWDQFFQSQNANLQELQKIDFTQFPPVLYDLAGNKFSIDFKNNRQNYQKKKGSIGSELISRAMGAGRPGKRILDLSAGLGIDAVFLAQLGYSVTAIERNALIYSALQAALENLSNETEKLKQHLKFVFADSIQFLKEANETFDVIYFDPMFPEKTKSALPRQEMVFFRNLVGEDPDAIEVLKLALHYPGIKRVVVKRPLKAEALGLKPHSKTEGKLVRFDIYGAQT